MNRFVTTYLVLLAVSTPALGQEAVPETLVVPTIQLGMTRAVIATNTVGLNIAFAKDDGSRLVPLLGYHFGKATYALSQDGGFSTRPASNSTYAFTGTGEEGTSKILVAGFESTLYAQNAILNRAGYASSLLFLLNSISTSIPFKITNGGAYSPSTQEYDANTESIGLAIGHKLSYVHVNEDNKMLRLSVSGGYRMGFNGSVRLSAKNDSYGGTELEKSLTDTLEKSAASSSLFLNFEVGTFF